MPRSERSAALAAQPSPRRSRSPCGRGETGRVRHPPVKPSAATREVRSREREAEEANADDAQRVSASEPVEAAEQPLQARDGSSALRGAAADQDLQPKQRLGLQQLLADLLALGSLLDHLRRAPPPDLTGLPPPGESCASPPVASSPAVLAAPAGLLE